MKTRSANNVRFLAYIEYVVCRQKEVELVSKFMKCLRFIRGVIRVYCDATQVLYCLGLFRKMEFCLLDLFRM